MCFFSSLLIYCILFFNKTSRAPVVTGEGEGGEPRGAVVLRASLSLSLSLSHAREVQNIWVGWNRERRGRAQPFELTGTTARTVGTRASVWWRRVLVAVAAVFSAPVGVFASSSPLRPSVALHGAGGAMSAIPTATTDAVLVQSVEMPAGSVKIEGYDFNRGVDHNALLDSFIASGFQASNFGMAVEEINKMRAWSLADEPVAEDEDEEFKDPEVRKKVKTTIFLGYTSNMASCGVRETIRYLCQHKMVDAIVATAGGVEEDIIKCLAPTYLGSSNPLHPTVTSGFELDGKTLRLQVRGGTRLRRACLPCSARDGRRLRVPPALRFCAAAVWCTSDARNLAPGPQPHRKPAGAQ